MDVPVATMEEVEVEVVEVIMIKQAEIGENRENPRTTETIETSDIVLRVLFTEVFIQRTNQIHKLWINK